MQISLLAAYTKKGLVLGSGGKIPWNLPKERNRFKRLCHEKYIIMGRKSFEEIGKPLSYCKIIVVSKTLSTLPQGLILKPTLESAIQFSFEKQNEAIIAGGQSLYEQALPLASKIYATEIYLDIKGDTFFPKLKNNWTKIIEETIIENKIKYDYVLYEKNL